MFRAIINQSLSSAYITLVMFQLVERSENQMKPKELFSYIHKTIFSSAYSTLVVFVLVERSEAKTNQRVSIRLNEDKTLCNFYVQLISL